MRADAARNLDRLLAAARDLFAERGPGIPLDEVARRAGVGNATLYRHFPTRGDLIVAVYADEVAALCRFGDDLTDPHTALFEWLDAFVVHIAAKRPLALAVTDNADQRRTRLFEDWHRSITATAERLLADATRAGAVSPGLAVKEVLALASAAAIAGPDLATARRLLALLRTGLEPRP